MFVFKLFASPWPRDGTFYCDVATHIFDMQVFLTPLP